MPSEDQKPFYYSNHMNLENQLKEDGIDAGNSNTLPKSSVRRYQTIPAAVPNYKTCLDNTRENNIG